MKITDVVISAILKKGILYEARNVDTDVEIPIVIENQERKIKINIKCEHVTLRVEKDEKTGFNLPLFFSREIYNLYYGETVGSNRERRKYKTSN